MNIFVRCDECAIFNVNARCRAKFPILNIHSIDAARIYNKQKSTLWTWRLVQCALNIENKFYYEPCRFFIFFPSLHAANDLIFFILCMLFISFVRFVLHSFMGVPLSLAWRHRFCCCTRAFHFMTYEIFIIPKTFDSGFSFFNVTNEKYTT